MELATLKYSLQHKLTDREDQVNLMLLLALKDCSIIGVVYDLEFSLGKDDEEEALRLISQVPRPTKEEIIECLKQVKFTKRSERSLLSKIMFNYFYNKNFWNLIAKSQVLARKAQDV